MNKSQTIEIINIINNNYKNFFDESRLDSIIKEWSIELSQYDYDDIKEALIECMSRSEFQMKPPTLYHLTSKCKKKHDKIDYNEIVYYCDLCGKPFNDMDELYKHRERENSVDYVIRQYKRWFDKDINKSELYAMEEKEFRLKYVKLLKYIQEHTNDDNEKRIIGYIFNPPNIQEAQKFINKNTMINN